MRLQHPEQAVLTGQRELIEEARSALAAYEAAGRRAIRFNGRMLEAPIVRRYSRIMAMASRRELIDA